MNILVTVIGHGFFIALGIYTKVRSIDGFNRLDAGAGKEILATLRERYVGENR